MDSRFVRLICGMLLVIMIPVWISSAQSDETATVIAMRAPLHVEPSTLSESLGNLARGLLLWMVGFDETAQWIAVVTPDGEHGWVSAAHVHVNGAYHPSADDLLFTVVDGSSEDWGRFGGAFEDATGDSSGVVDLRSARSYLNDRFLYVILEADGDLEMVQLVLLDIVTGTDGGYGTYQYALPQSGSGSLFALTDVRGENRGASGVVTAREEALEIRLPLALLDGPETVTLVKISFAEDITSGIVISDEMVGHMPAVTPMEVEPVADARVGDVRVNLRQSLVDGSVVMVLEPDTQLTLVGRNETGSWVLVRLANGSCLGWVSAEYIRVEKEVLDLRIR